MKVAIIALTCGRVEYTQKTWANNIHRIPFSVFHFDNTEDEEERRSIRLLTTLYDSIKRSYYSDSNQGIAGPINYWMERLFASHYDIVVTMANDILEPANWIDLRVKAFQNIPNAGIVSIPIIGQGCIRYQRKAINNITFEEGNIIGNFAISRAVYEAIGGFPECYGLYGPIDLDYCAHARKAGFRTIYLSDYEARHIGTNNPTEYQKAKEESLAKSWALYHERMKALQ